MELEGGWVSSFLLKAEVEVEWFDHLKASRMKETAFKKQTELEDIYARAQLEGMPCTSTESGEYARWLVKLNCMLERNPKHRLLPSMLLSGGADQAFDDICIEDPDFWSILVLAESGIVPSKLSDNTSSFPDYDGLQDKGSVNFTSESFEFSTIRSGKFSKTS